MNSNIKELEGMTESLQSELSNKEAIFEVLRKENKELDERLEAKTKEEHVNSQQAMRRLEDELGFLKKHHDLEINMLKEQYERSLETAKVIAQETAKINQGKGGESRCESSVLDTETDCCTCCDDSERSRDSKTASNLVLRQGQAHRQDSSPAQCSARAREGSWHPHQSPPPSSL